MAKKRPAAEADLFDLFGVEDLVVTPKPVTSAESLGDVLKPNGPPTPDCEATVEWLFNKEPNGELGDSYYEVTCNCGWKHEVPEGTELSERAAHAAKWDHMGIDWRSRPVYISTTRDVEKWADGIPEFVRANYPASFTGPVRTMFGGCANGNEIDTHDGILTDHGCRGVVPESGRNTDGHPEVCACGCHESDEETLPRRCGNGKNDCKEIAVAETDDRGWVDPTKTSDGRRLNKCAEHYRIWREQQTLDLEVGNSFYWRVAGDSPGAHNRYPSDPDVIDPESNDAWRWRTYSYGTRTNRRDPSRLLREWDYMHNGYRVAEGHHHHDLNNIWSGVVDSAVAAGYDAERTYRAPEDMHALLPPSIEEARKQTRASTDKRPDNGTIGLF